MPELHWSMCLNKTQLSSVNHGSWRNLPWSNFERMISHFVWSRNGLDGSGFWGALKLIRARFKLVGARGLQQHHMDTEVGRFGCCSWLRFEPLIVESEFVVWFTNLQSSFILQYKWINSLSNGYIKGSSASVESIHKLQHERWNP